MLILASSSPRRQELLRNAGIDFIVQPADIPEMPLPGEVGKAFAERMAKEKALAVFKHQPNDLVLGADTVVVVGGEILGKPANDDDAARMLRMLSGKTHEVITGVCLFGRPRAGKHENRVEDVGSETTLVTVNALTDAEIRDYVATGEPWDKAGAYAIQGRASRWIPRIEGDYFNVVGLPVALVWRMLKNREWPET
jgi:septum formation protein